MSSRALVGGAILAWLALAGCARGGGPEAVALEYVRALYAGDPARAYRLISTEDQGVKDEQAFLRERDAATGFALAVAGQLASFIEGDTVEKTIKGERATLKLKLRLPNANAPEITALVRDWDERRLNALPQTEQEQITQKLAELRRVGQIPTLEGEETLELVREKTGWRVFLNWAGGIRVRFAAALPAVIPLQVTFVPEELLISPGERARVIVRVKNISTREVVSRVSHRIEPKPAAESLAVVQCPLFLPVRLPPGQAEEFSSEYLLLKDVPAAVKQFQVTYDFLAVGQARETKMKR